MEKRDRDWLLDYVRQEIPDTPRNRRYLALTNRALDDTFLGIDVGWLQKGGAEGYRARGQTNTIGRLAFCWRTPGLRFYHDPEVLEILRRAYLGVAAHTTSEGQFIWPDDQDMYWAGSHEHAWRLEPLLIGYMWAGEQFPEEDQGTIQDALRRAADWLAANPCNQLNNRGAVWCAITTLCGLYYERQEMLEVVEAHADDIMAGVVLDDGEVGEHTKQYVGGGPCTNYTYTGLSYVYLYRLFSGKDEMDSRLLKGMRWLSLYNTLSGYPNAAGASVRVVSPSPAIQDALPALERSSRDEPFLARVAEAYLDRQVGEKGLFGGHIISPLIWAMFEAGAASSANPLPEWYVNWAEVYERPDVSYALVGRTYQTGVTFRARPGPYRDIPEEGAHLRGMQTFAPGDEVPILFHSREVTSTTVADGIDTAVTNVSGGPDGREVVLNRGEFLTVCRSELATILERRGHLWTLYAYTPVSAVVVSGGARGDIRCLWALNVCGGDPAMDEANRAVVFPDRKGRIVFLQGGTELYGRADRWVLEVTTGPPVSATAFCDASFRFEGRDVENGVLRFSDGSGDYRILLKDVLNAEGNLDRQAPMRLVRD